MDHESLMLFLAHRLSMTYRRCHSWVNDISGVKSQKISSLLQEWVAHLFYEINQFFELFSKIIWKLLVCSHWLVVFSLQGCLKLTNHPQKFRTSDHPASEGRGGLSKSNSTTVTLYSGIVLLMCLVQRRKRRRRRRNFI